MKRKYYTPLHVARSTDSLSPLTVECTDTKAAMAVQLDKVSCDPEFSSVAPMQEAVYCNPALLQGGDF